MSKREEKDRIDYIDLYRGLGIILMIMAHIGFGKQFDHYVHAFHMPMFFFVSGYFFKLQATKDFCLLKMRALLIPYMLYAILLYFFSKLAFGQPKDSMLHMLLFMNDTDFIAAALWFLPALFFANAFYFVLRKCFHNEVVISMICVIVAIIGNAFHEIYKGTCVFAIDAAMVGVGLMHGAFIFRHNKWKPIKKLSNLQWNELVIGFILVSFLIILNEKINMREGNYRHIPLFWFNAFTMCIILWNVAKKAIEIIGTKHNGIVIRAVSNGLINIGKRSLPYLGLNQIFIYIFFTIFPTKTSNSFLILIHNLIGFIFVLLVIYPFSILLDKKR